MKYTLATTNFDNAVLYRRKPGSDEVDTVKTNIQLPQWIKVTMAIQRIEAKLPETLLYTRTINHGTAIFNHRYKNTIEDFDENALKMLRSKNRYIINSIIGMEIYKTESERKTVSIPIWCNDSMTKSAGALRISKALLWKVIIALSLNTNNGLEEEFTPLCHNEIIEFEKSLEEFVEFCDKLTR